MNIGSFAIGAGAVTTLWGIKNYISATKVDAVTAKKNPHLQRNAIALTTLGVALIGLGISYGPCEKATPPHLAIAKMPKWEPAPKQQIVAGVPVCNDDLIADIRASLPEGSQVRRLAEATGLSCETYLPWQDSFRIEGTNSINIQSKDIPKLFGWGVQPMPGHRFRFYVAISYTCNDHWWVGTQTIFQSISDLYNNLEAGWRYTPKTQGNLCYLDPQVITVDNGLLRYLAELFRGEQACVTDNANASCLRLTRA